MVEEMGVETSEGEPDGAMEGVEPLEDDDIVFGDFHANDVSSGAAAVVRITISLCFCGACFDVVDDFTFLCSAVLRFGVL